MVMTSRVIYIALSRLLRHSDMLSICIDHKILSKHEYTAAVYGPYIRRCTECLTYFDIYTNVCSIYFFTMKGRTWHIGNRIARSVYTKAISSNMMCIRYYFVISHYNMGQYHHNTHNKAPKYPCVYATLYLNSSFPNGCILKNLLPHIEVETRCLPCCRRHYEVPFLKDTLFELCCVWPFPDLNSKWSY